MNTDRQHWNNLSEAFAFLGNSLLAPMSQTGPVGLNPDFWASFPNFESEEVASALTRCRSLARTLSSCEGAVADAVQRVSVEFTKLFVGPPKPAAPPWETAWRGGGAVGYGEAAVQMRRFLGEIGLGVSNDNNQYADHIGIELLYASILCTRISEGTSDRTELETFLHEHPLAWIGGFRTAVTQTAPGGYFDCILELTESIMRICDQKGYSLLVTFS